MKEREFKGKTKRLKSLDFKIKTKQQTKNHTYNKYLTINVNFIL